MAFDCLNNLTISHIQNILKYSGRGPMRFGSYHSCIAQPEMDYNIIMIDAGSSFLVPTGLCLPRQCQPNQIKFAANKILQKLSIPVSVASVQNHLEDYQYPLTFWFYVAVFVIVGALILFLLATCSKSIGRHHILSTFSFKNSMKIFRYHITDLNVLNGIRSLAMLWVIFGHEYSLDFTYAQNFLTVQKNQLSQPIFLMTLAGLFSVDTFFFIGGFLAAYAVLKQPSQSLLKYPLAILNRYLRIVPAYFVAILIYYGLMMQLGSGPFWSANAPQVEMCAPLWKPLLFVDNLVDNAQSMCMGWGWYLQNDMQMFIYCMLILLIYKYDRFSSFVVIYMSIAASFAYVMQQTYDNKYKNLTHFVDAETQAQYQFDIYYKPWARCPPYLYGLFLGILYYEYLQFQKNPQENRSNILVSLKQKFKSSPMIRRMVELLGVLIGCFICFIPRTAQGDHYWPQFAHSVYLTYGKVIFVFSVSLIILPSILGIQTFIKFIMDTKFFNFIAKISFCTYLIHLTILIHWFTTRGITAYYAFQPKYFTFVSHTALSLLFGYFMTILFEIPCSKLQKVFMNKLITKSVKDHHKNQKQQENPALIKQQPLLNVNASLASNQLTSIKDQINLEQKQ